MSPASPVDPTPPVGPGEPADAPAPLHDHDHPEEGLGSPEIFAFLGGFVLVAGLALLVAWSAGLLPARGAAASAVVRRADPAAAAPQVVERAEVAYPVGAFRFTSQEGTPFGSEELRGRWWVGAFVFSGCASICPPMMIALRRVQDAIADLPPAVQLVCFSVDPDNDTPEVLKKWGTRYGADFTRWTLLTGDRTAIWTTAQQGFRLGVGEDPSNTAMPVLHSRRLALVDPDGVVRAFYDGLETAEVDALIARLRELAPPAR